MTNSSVLRHMTFSSLKLKVFVCLLCRVCLDPPARRERTETSEPWWDLNCCGFFSLPASSTCFPRTRGRGERLCWSFWRFLQRLLSWEGTTLLKTRVGEERADVNPNGGIQLFVFPVFCSCLLPTCSLDADARTSLIIINCCFSWQGPPGPPGPRGPQGPSGASVSLSFFLPFLSYF